MDVIREKFVGEWKVYKSENFEQFLQEVGANFILRKIASFAKPTMTISVGDDNTITIHMKIGPKDEISGFRLDEEFEIERNDEKQIVMPTWEDNKLKLETKPKNGPTAKTKPATFYREVVDGEMILTMCTGSVVCKRYFKRVEH